MSDERRWQDAKIPQWVREAVQADIDQWRLTAALTWPTEAKPAPLPFQWGPYDKVIGAPEPGRYWVSYRSTIEAFDLARVKDVMPEKPKVWETWAFRSDKGKWNTSVVRGPLFASEADAKLYRRWLMCEDFARQLMGAM